jgi:hypothetical protein
MVYQYDIETRQEEYNPDDYRKDVAFQKWKQMCQEEPRTDWNMWMNIKKVVQAGVESERSRHEERAMEAYCKTECNKEICAVPCDSLIRFKHVFGGEKKQ